MRMALRLHSRIPHKDTYSLPTDIINSSKGLLVVLLKKRKMVQSRSFGNESSAVFRSGQLRWWFWWSSEGSSVDWLAAW